MLRRRLVIGWTAGEMELFVHEVDQESGDGRSLRSGGDDNPHHRKQTVP